MNYILIITNILLLVAGQALWKFGIGKMMLNGWGSILSVMFSPWIVAGVFLYVIATGIWIYLLSKFPLSFLYPMQSLAYVIGLLIAIYFFQEQIPLSRWIGVGVIMIGVYLVAK